MNEHRSPRNARERRAEAMNMLAELYWPATRDYQHTGASAADMADNIAKLAALGRTPRWAKAITDWAQAVRIATPDTLNWAFFQYAVHAGHAAD